jgi:ribosomal protein S12 methylthiotransferase
LSIKYFSSSSLKTIFRISSVPSIALHNLGCSKNQIDGERMLGMLVKAGFSAVADFSMADIIIVNTCAFILEAQQEAIDAILESARFKTSGRCSLLAVAGCFSQRFRNEARIRLPEVDLWLGVHDWPKLLQTALHLPKASSDQRVLFLPVATQYLKIAEGCSRRCSFCAIPFIRGPLKSRPGPEIIKEAQWLYSRGVRECILVSQDTSSYGKDIGGSLTRLLEQLLAKTKFPWIRLMYLHPQCVDDSFLRLIAQEKRLLPYFDIPLQHISDEILISMKRRPLSKGIFRLLERIRAMVPDAAVRTTLIAGYPGETKRHFEELLAFVEKARFEHLGVFPFSPEKGTAAYSLAKRPTDSTTGKRCEMIMSLARDISSRACASRIGKTIDVIIDGPAREHDVAIDAGARRTKAPHALEGRSVWDAPDVDGTVFIPGGGVPVGAIVPVTVVSAGDYELFGVPAAR